VARFLSLLLCTLGAAGLAASLWPARAAADSLFAPGAELALPVNAFADRDRRRFVAAGEPCAAAVGLVDADDVDREGTGTVVLHPRIVLTAAHVVLDVARGRPAERVTFRLGYAKGRAVADIGARVAALGTMRPGTVGTAKDDWAILVLDRPAPARPYELAMPTTATLARRYRRALSVIGYSDDRADGEIASTEAGCSVVGERYGRFLHDCSTANGASGAALTVATATACVTVGLVDGAVSPRPVARAPFRLAIANSAVMPVRFRDRLLATVEELKRALPPLSAESGRPAGRSR
jgi:V8-like Glu-specific endopeptidase